ncbi:MAG: hypothetical protein NVSMB65_12270 [Chloroflexota bacterium]
MNTVTASMRGADTTTPPRQGDGISPEASRRASVRIAMGAFAINRLVLLVISYLTGRLFHDAVGKDYSLGGLWQRWDVLWYIRVADHGYYWRPPPLQSDLAFFPLFPLLMHLLTLISPLSAYGAGLVIANVSFAVALYLLHRLVSQDFGADTAERAVTYLALFPTALYFFTAYSESLYLALCLGCAYALRLRRWWAAGACGMAAALTRQLGVLLVVLFVAEYLAAVAPTARGRGEWGRLAAALLIPAGILAFMLYLQLTLGNGLLFLRAQAAWQRTLGVPWQGAALAIRDAFGTGSTIRIPLRTLNLVDLSFLALLLALLARGIRWLPRSYSLYAATVVLAILINPATGSRQPLHLLSVSRFSLTIFPPLIVLALLGRRRLADRLIIAAFVALLSFFTVIFVRARWIA